MAEGDGKRYGPVLIGVFLNCMLYGATGVQTLIYFQTFKSDKWRIKILVLYLLFCETLNTVFNIGVVYDPLIAHYGSPRVATTAPLMLATHPLTTVMISLPVQLFIAWRVKVMSKSNILPIIIGFLAITAFVGGVATAAALIVINFEYARFAQNNAAVVTWLVSSAVADIVITVSLVRSLMWKRTGFAASDDVINRIIRLTVQTGLATAVTATLDVTLYLTLEGRSWNYIWNFMLSKLYTNALLSSLNARGGWKAASVVRDNVLFGNGTGAESTARNHTQIEIVTSVTRTTDVEPRQTSHAVPMKVLDSGDCYSGNDSDSNSAIHAIPVYAEAV